MRARRIGSFIKDEGAGATVEFVAIIGPFLLLTFFIFEIIIAVLWIGTSEKAVQLGARLAVVSNFAVTSLTPTATNPLVDANHAYGQPCPAACSSPAFTTATCVHGTGGVCDAANFTTLVNRMRSISSLIDNQYVTITYSYVGLGFAGGPIVPGVTVTLSGVPYGAVVTTILGKFFDSASPLVTLPTISVTLTGEDLSTAGA